MYQLLFVYGTLRDPDLLALVLGRAVDPRNVVAAMAPGHRAACLPGRTYPGLRRAPGVAAEGLLLLGLSRFELQLLDAFEGDEYRRDMLPVIVEGELHRAPPTCRWRRCRWRRPTGRSSTGGSGTGRRCSRSRNWLRRSAGRGCRRCGGVDAGAAFALTPPRFAPITRPEARAGFRRAFLLLMKPLLEAARRTCPAA